MRILVLVAISIAMPAAARAQNSMSNGPSSADELNQESPPAPANTATVLSDDPSSPDTVVTNHPGNMVSVPPSDQHKSYPVCTAALQDNCQNRGEGGARGRSRALKYWPGKPASEQ